MSEKRFFGREDILQIDDLPTEDVYVEPWGAWVRVRALTAGERDAYQNSMFEVRHRGRGQPPEIRYKPEKASARLVALSVIDEQGNRLFTEADVEALARKNARAIDIIAAVARRLSGLDEEALEEAEGNSGPELSGGSSIA